MNARAPVASHASLLVLVDRICVIENKVVGIDACGSGCKIGMLFISRMSPKRNIVKDFLFSLLIADKFTETSSVFRNRLVTVCSVVDLVDFDVVAIPIFL